MLSYPDYNKPFDLTTDASAYDRYGVVPREPPHNNDFKNT